MPSTSPRTGVPTEAPSNMRPLPPETNNPTLLPTTVPTKDPTHSPTSGPTGTPTTEKPTQVPTVSPTYLPTMLPTAPPAATATPTTSPTKSCSPDRLENVILEINDDVYVDIDESGTLSPGDLFVFEENELSTPTFPMGNSVGHCTILENVSQNDNLYCTINFDFPEGTIVFQGVFAESTIVGGTGCYSGLQGTGSPTFDSGNFFHNITRDSGVVSPSCSSDWLDATWVEEGGDTYVDSDRSGSVTPGDVFVFDSNQVSVTADDDTVLARGTTAGVCMVMPRVNDNSFCLISFTFQDDATNTTIGTLTVMGSFASMSITGGTGCFGGTSGLVQGGSDPLGFAYEFTIDPRDGSTLPSEDCTPDIFDLTWMQAGEPFFADYNRDGAPSPGEMYLMQDHAVQVGANVQGTATGQCIVMPEMDEFYCRMTFSFEEGSLVAVGFFGEMVISAASGCFRHVKSGLMRGKVADGTVHADGIYDYIFEDIIT